MDDMPSRQNVTHYRLTAKIAEERIRKTAVSSANIVWSAHALARMSEREIFDADVLRILRGGFCGEEPEKTQAGEWKCKMTLRLRGSREAGAVVIILRGGRLLIKTVEWEDMV